MQVSLHSYSTSTGYHPTIKIVGFLARKLYKFKKQTIPVNDNDCFLNNHSKKKCKILDKRTIICNSLSIVFSNQLLPPFFQTKIAWQQDPFDLAAMLFY